MQDKGTRAGRCGRVEQRHAGERRCDRGNTGRQVWQWGTEECRIKENRQGGVAGGQWHAG